MHHKLIALPGVYLLQDDRYLLVFGDPPHGENPDSPDAHNCDEMMCSSVGEHTLAHIKISIDDAKKLQAMMAKKVPVDVSRKTSPRAVLIAQLAATIAAGESYAYSKTARHGDMVAVERAEEILTRCESRYK